MRIEKKQIVNDIGNILTKSKFVYMATYKGLKVKEFSELRQNLDTVKAFCCVFKNTLIKKAAELKGIEDLAKVNLVGDTVLISGNGDASAVAKLLSDFSKKHGQVQFKYGYFEGAMLSAAEVNTIAKLPTREVLLAQLLGVLQAPSRNLVSVLNAKLSSIVYVLNSYKEQKSKN